ncbi:protein PALS2-like [Haliotis cracherodii]|uniref:protein PALS2-like n=1 Tax=Haliotis cracherodii TaxID=6455 RepID=UPI0039E8F996
MPAAIMENSAGQDAIRELCDSMDVLMDNGAQADDLDFLQDLLQDPALLGMVQAKENIERKTREPKTLQACDISKEVQFVLDNNRDKDSREAAALDNIMQNPHFRALMRAHDEVADKQYGDDVFDTMQLDAPPPPVFNAITEQIRFVTIRKSTTEPLGITVKLDEMNDLVIARILSDSVIDRQGLLRVGDIIRDVNGYPVATPEHLMDIIMDADSNIMLKIVPSYNDHANPELKYMKAHFTYDPLKDRLIPCKDAGLPFQDGDVLEIINEEDPNWWQARIADVNGPTGLIPSQSLEEKRKAFVQPDFDYSKGSLLCGLTRKKKKKYKYSSKASKEFDKCDLMIYEEVVRMAPFKRRILVLVGAHGVGRRSLKERLIRDDPKRFGAVMPHTSRAPREGEENGKGYYFIDRETMDADINDAKYIEYGEFNGNIYGTKIESIYDVIRSGKMCVLDVNPTSLKVLKSPEFTSYIVFIAAPSVEALKVMYEDGRKLLRGTKDKRGVNMVELRSEEDFIRTVQESAQIEQVYKAYFDETIVNDSFEETFRSIRKLLGDMEVLQQWVPVNWVY